MEPLPYGRKYAHTPPDAYESDTSALDNESQELEGPSLRYYATDGQFYMGRRVYDFSDFPKKIGPLPEPEYRPMSYSLIGDYVTEEERAADCLYEQNLQDWKHDNISYLKGLTPDQLKMWKLHYHIELEQVRKRVQTAGKYKALKDKAKYDSEYMKIHRQEMKEKELEKIE